MGFFDWFKTESEPKRKQSIEFGDEVAVYYDETLPPNFRRAVQPTMAVCGNCKYRSQDSKGHMTCSKYGLLFIGIGCAVVSVCDDCSLKPLF